MTTVAVPSIWLGVILVFLAFKFTQSGFWIQQCRKHDEMATLVRVMHVLPLLHMGRLCSAPLRCLIHKCFCPAFQELAAAVFGLLTLSSRIALSVLVTEI